jgi:hypothetical protein
VGTGVEDEVVNAQLITAIQLVFESDNALFPNGVGGGDVDEIRGMGDDTVDGAFPAGPEKALTDMKGQGSSPPLKLVFGENLNGLAAESLSPFDGTPETAGDGDMAT